MLNSRFACNGNGFELRHENFSVALRHENFSVALRHENFGVALRHENVH